jgi:hypothetical protein
MVIKRKGIKMEVLQETNNRRLPNVLFEIQHLFKKDYEEVEDVNLCVQVFDITRNEILFRSKCPFLVGYYFESLLKLESSESFKTIVKIESCISDEEEFLVTAEFVGMEPFIAERINLFKKIS